VIDDHTILLEFSEISAIAAKIPQEGILALPALPFPERNPRFSVSEQD
jgi:hypothetical protein